MQYIRTIVNYFSETCYRIFLKSSSRSGLVGSMNTGDICSTSQGKQGFEKAPEKHLCNPKSF